MRYWTWALLLTLTLATAAACSHVFVVATRLRAAASPGGGNGNGSSAPTTGTLVADNSRCFVCHVNFQEEKMTVSHAARNVGCELCHGSSDAHCNDENNITAPDKFYAHGDVNALCYGCHDPKNLNQVIHKNIIAGTFDRKVCTDCHGDHRMARRTRHWDKTTKKVLLTNTVESEKMVTLPPAK